MNKMRMNGIVGLTLVAIATLLCVPQTGLAQENDTVTLLTAPFGSGSYVFGSALEEIARESESKLRISHSETPGVAYNIMKLDRNEGEREKTVIISSPTLIERAQKGLKPFRKKMGKDIVSLAGIFAAGRWMVSRDADIEAYKDLKGKTVGLGNKQQTNFGLTPFLEITVGAGLDPKDLDLKWLGTNSSAAAFKDHQLDVCVVGGYFNPVTRKFFPAPFFQEMMATEKDLNNFGPTKEDLARVAAKFGSSARPYEIKPGELSGVKNPVTVNIALGTLSVYKVFPEDVAYEMTKLLIAEADKFARYHSLGKILTKEMLCWGLEPVELHPGAYRAYREAGLMK